jgi:hypothetical protein
LKELNQKRKGKLCFEIDSIFGNLKGFIHLTEILLGNLLDKSKRFTESFEEIIPWLKLYVEYINNYEDSMNLLKLKIKSDPEFCWIIQNGKLDERSNGFDLQALLSKPYQRIFGYKTILERFFRYENSKEMEEIVCKINKLVSFINESKRLHENFKRISQCVSDEKKSSKPNLFSKIFQFPILTVIKKFKK